MIAQQKDIHQRPACAKPKLRFTCLRGAEAPLRRRQGEGRRGFTLTEIAIVLGVVGIILGAVWVAASSVYQNNRTARAAQQVAQIVAGFKTIYGSKPINLGAVEITGLAINNNIIPPDAVPSGVNCADVTGSNSSCYAVGPWTGSQLHVWSAQSNNSIVIEFSGLGLTACDNLANALITSTAGLTGAYIKGAATLNLSFPPYGTNSPPTASQIQGACGTSSDLQIYYSLN